MFIENALWEAVRILVLFILPLSAVVGVVSLIGSTISVFTGIRDPILGYVVRLLAVIGVGLLGGMAMFQALLDMTSDLLG